MALLKIAVNVVEGKEPVGDLISKIESLVGIAAKPVEDAVENFVEQFASDFGQQMLSGAVALAPQVISGQTSIKDAGAQLLATATTDAVTDAEKDGTVALNALRVQITAATVPAPAATTAAAG